MPTSKTYFRRHSFVVKVQQFLEEPATCHPEHNAVDHQLQRDQGGLLREGTDIRTYGY